MIKLSELPDNTYIYSEKDGQVLFVDNLKELLRTHPESVKGDYYTTYTERFRFNAQTLIEQALTDYEESGDGYEDMADLCLETVEPAIVRQIQDLLDQITQESSRFVVYFEDELIDINN